MTFIGVDKETMIPKQIRFSHKIQSLIAFVIIGIFFWLSRISDKQRAETQRYLRNELNAMHAEQVVSFKIHPTASNPKNYSRAIELVDDRQLVADFFQAIQDQRPYRPSHDKAVVQWGMEVATDTSTIHASCHIPDDAPHIVACRISSPPHAGFTDFQSEALRQWYPTYLNHWKVSSHTLSKPDLLTTSLSGIEWFRITMHTSSVMPESVDEFSPYTDIVRDFFQAFQDVRFIAVPPNPPPAQWEIDIRFKTTAVHLEGFFSQGQPEAVRGMLEVDTGYVYFLSESLYEWFLQYAEYLGGGDE